MAIILILGNVGSGKTASIVREMVMNEQGIRWFTNITPTKPKLTPWIIKIDASMIVQKELISVVTRRKTGKETPVYDFKLNKEFWQSIKEPISVVLDEVHTIMNPRRSMSKVAIIATDWLAMLRRVIGEDPLVEGDLYLITQLGRRVEVIGREMAHQVRYYVCHYDKTCTKCGTTWRETSESPEKLKLCIQCGHNRLKKNNHAIEVMHFAGMSAFEGWRDFNINTYYAHYFIDDIENYFSYYNTHQWEDLFSTLY